MARYRTVKPELWTDEAFVECSANARLLFIAALNFASDYGVMLDSPVQLKMQCFPGDSLDVRPLVDELVSQRLWLRTTAPDGALVLVIRTFLDHQRVDKPQSGRWGDWRKWSEFPEPSPNDPRTLPERSGLKERTNGVERDERPADPAVDNPDELPGKGPSSSFSLSEQVAHQLARWQAKAKPPESIEAWLPTTRRGILADRVQDITAALVTHPNVNDAARSLVPAHVTQALTGTKVIVEAWYANPHCDDCPGDGWTSTEHGAAPCDCRRAEPYMADVIQLRGESA